MRPVKRSYANKRASAGQFKRNVSRVKSPNLNLTPMRGGWRL